LLRRVASRGVLPRERFSPVALLRHADGRGKCPLIGKDRKWSAHRQIDANGRIDSRATRAHGR